MAFSGVAAKRRFFYGRAMRKSLAMGLLVLTLIPATGCRAIAKMLTRKAEEQAAQAAKAAAAGASASADAEEPDDVLGEKLHAYIDCTNGVHLISEGRGRYRKWIGGKDGRTFPAKPSGSPMVWEISEHQLEVCTGKLLKAKALTPAEPTLDVPAAAYSKALNKLAPLVDAAHTYYVKMSDYKDDNYAKGRASHAELSAAYDEYSTAMQAFDSAVVTANTLHLKKLRDQVEKTEGRKLHWQKMNFDAKAKVFIDMLDEERTTPAQLKKEVSELNESLTQLMAYAKANPAERDKVMMWSMYESGATRYVSEAKEVARGFDGKNPITERERGHGQDIIDLYNSLIDDANRLKF